MPRVTQAYSSLQNDISHLVISTSVVAVDRAMRACVLFVTHPQWGGGVGSLIIKGGFASWVVHQACMHAVNASLSQCACRALWYMRQHTSHFIIAPRLESGRVVHFFESDDEPNHAVMISRKKCVEQANMEGKRGEARRERKREGNHRLLEARTAERSLDLTNAQTPRTS